MLRASSAGENPALRRGQPHERALQPQPHLVTYRGQDHALVARGTHSWFRIPHAVNLVQFVHAEVADVQAQGWLQRPPDVVRPALREAARAVLRWSPHAGEVQGQLLLLALVVGAHGHGGILSVVRCRSDHQRCERASYTESGLAPGGAMGRVLLLIAMTIS